MSLPTNFFIGRGGGSDAFPTWTYSSPSTISGISKDSQSYTSAENATGTGLFFSENGTKMYLTMYGQNAIYEYDLSTAWDQSTASYSNVNFSFNQQDTNGIASYIKPDGTTLYMTSYGTYKSDVWQYSMSTPWNISTLSYTGKRLQISSNHDAAGIFMSRDGTRVYLGNYSDGIIRQHNLSTAWDISTASTSHNSEKNIGNLVSDTGGGWYEFWMSPDGTECYYFRSTVDYIYRTVLTTPWDITTATYAGPSQNRFNLGQYSVSGLPAYGVYVKPDGSKLYTYHQGNGQVNRFSL